MFVIRSDQHAALDAAVRDGFHHRLFHFLRQELPDETADFSDEALLRMVGDWDSQANRYSVESEAGIAQWACLSVMLAGQLDNIPEVRDFLLDHEGFPGTVEERLDLLVHCLEPVAADEPSVLAAVLSTKGSAPTAQR